MRIASAILSVASAVVCSLVALGVGCSTPKPANPTASRVAESLERLLHVRSNSAFVVVEDKPTGKFVQFAASTQAPLVMDLPLSLLDESQQARAKDFFEGLGVHGESRPLAAKGRVSLTHQSWTINFDRDSKKAAERTIALFREVYQIPDDRLPDLSVEENLGD